MDNGMCVSDNVAAYIQAFFDFGDRPVSKKHSTLISITNAGNYPLIFSWCITGDQFYITPERGILPIAETMKCSLSFRPTVARAYEETFTLNCAGEGDESGETKKYNLTVTGVGESEKPERTRVKRQRSDSSGATLENLSCIREETRSKITRNKGNLGNVGLNSGAPLRVGTVKSFCKKVGRGLISDDQHLRDISVCAIDVKGGAVEQGDIVTYDLRLGPGGKGQAVNVQLLNNDGDKGDEALPVMKNEGDMASVGLRSTSNMQVGKVMSFDDKDGCGFIRADNISVDVKVYDADVQGMRVNPGDLVKFDSSISQDGQLTAINVEVLNIDDNVGSQGPEVDGPESMVAANIAPAKGKIFRTVKRNISDASESSLRGQDWSTSAEKWNRDWSNQSDWNRNWDSHSGWNRDWHSPSDWNRDLHNSEWRGAQSNWNRDNTSDWQQDWHGNSSSDWQLGSAGEEDMGSNKREYGHRRSIEDINVNVGDFNLEDYIVSAGRSLASYGHSPSPLKSTTAAGYGRIITRFLSHANGVASDDSIKRHFKMLERATGYGSSEKLLKGSATQHQAALNNYFRYLKSTNVICKRELDALISLTLDVGKSSRKVLALQEYHSTKDLEKHRERNWVPRGGFIKPDCVSLESLVAKCVAFRERTLIKAATERSAPDLIHMRIQQLLTAWMLLFLTCRYEELRDIRLGSNLFVEWTDLAHETYSLRYAPGKNKNSGRLSTDMPWGRRNLIYIPPMLAKMIIDYSITSLPHVAARKQIHGVRGFDLLDYSSSTPPVPQDLFPGYASIDATGMTEEEMKEAASINEKRGSAFKNELAMTVLGYGVQTIRRIIDKKLLSEYPELSTSAELHLGHSSQVRKEFYVNGGVVRDIMYEPLCKLLSLEG